MNVETLDVYGSDLKISSYAGISYGKDNPSKSRLLTLIKQGHESPFRLGGLVLKCKLPLFVFRQIQRTEIGRSFLEKSYRYVKADNATFYIFPEQQNTLVNNAIADSYSKSLETYNYLVEEEGIKPEVARAVLPQGIYVELIGYWSLSALMRLYKTRTLNKHAQNETREFVKLMWNEVEKYFPITAKAFNEQYKEE
jgi:flavin-dependent thymidylate synthase